MTNQSKNKLQKFINHVLRKEKINFGATIMFSKTMCHMGCYGITLLSETSDDISFPYKPIILCKGILKDRLWGSKLTAVHELSHMISELKYKNKVGVGTPHDKKWGDIYKDLVGKYLLEQLGECAYDIYECSGFDKEDMEKLEEEDKLYYSTKEYMANSSQKKSLRFKKKNSKFITKFDISRRS